MFDSLSRNAIGILIGIALLVAAIAAGSNMFSSSNDSNMATSVGNDTLVMNDAFRARLATNSAGVGTTAGFSATTIKDDINNFGFDAGANALLSKAFVAVSYTAAAGTVVNANDAIAITINGMTAAAEAQAKTQWASSSSLVTDSTAGDGILVVTTRF